MKINLLRFISVLVIGTLGIVNGQMATAVTDYAVLISGRNPSSVGSYGGGARLIFDEFWNDTYLMWEILSTKTGMQDSSSSVLGQIRVLYADGVDYPDAPLRYKAIWHFPGIPGARITDYPATYVNVANIFTWLRDGNQGQGIPHSMNEYEELFCWTFDHGASASGHSFLCLYDTEMMDSVFADRVNQIDAGKRVFWMQQCYSGGFIDDLANNKNIIITACSATEPASRADDVSRNGSPLPENELGNHHGEFNFHIMNAVRGTTIYPYNNPPVVDADANNDGGVSMFEAWTYVYDHESGLETPQCSDVGNIASTTFLDYAPPTAPPNLTGYSNINGVYLDWDPSTDNETAVKHYLIKRTPAFPSGLIDSITTLTQFWDWTVKSYTSYNYRIFAVDLASNISPRSSITIRTGYVKPPIPLSGGPQIVSEQTMGNPGFVNISQNPVRKNAVITFSTPGPGCVNVAIYDVQGKKVREILNAYRPAGIHGINFEVEHIESGVYFVRLNTHNFSDVQKLIIAK